MNHYHGLSAGVPRVLVVRRQPKREQSLPLALKSQDQYRTLKDMGACSNSQQIYFFAEHHIRQKIAISPWSAPDIIQQQIFVATTGSSLPFLDQWAGAGEDWRSAPETPEVSAEEYVLPEIQGI